MEMNSVMATEIVAAEVEHIVLPQIVSIKQASRMLGLPPYYLRRLCKEVPGVAFQSGIKWYINLGKLVDYYNNSGRNAAGSEPKRAAMSRVSCVPATAYRFYGKRCIVWLVRKISQGGIENGIHRTAYPKE